MSRGKTTRLKVSLTATDRQTLQAWQLATTMPAGLVRRGRILLLLEEGRPITEIAHMVGISRRFVYKWVRRFQAQGVAGLEALRHPGPWGARRRAAQARGLEDDDTPCLHCGEAGCERSCTGALLADAEEDEA